MVAIAQVVHAFQHAVVENHIMQGLLGYAMLFFGIWWAWMNYTWLASAYDNDDVPFRLASLVQITGALVMAAGVERGFKFQDFDIVFIGYAIMRASLVYLWLRAASHDPKRRKTNLRYATGLSVVMVGWGTMFVLGEWPLGFWLALALVELAIPVWAESAGNTSWHRHHIAERYGLLTIIVLGESVLAASLAVQSFMGENISTWELLPLIVGGLLILFSLWWMYFSKPAHQFLESNREAFIWGYGHYFIFASAAAIGGGLAVNIEHLIGHTEISDSIAAASVTVPVAVFYFFLYILQVRPLTPDQPDLAHGLFPAGIVATLLATFTAIPVLLTGIFAAILVAIGMMVHIKKSVQ